MEISLTNPQLTRFVEESIRHGEFRSASEVVEAGLARLMLDQPQESVDPGTLAAIDEGLAQVARGEDRDFEEFAAEFRKKYLGK